MSSILARTWRLVLCQSKPPDLQAFPPRFNMAGRAASLAFNGTEEASLSFTPAMVLYIDLPKGEIVVEILI